MDSQAVVAAVIAAQPAAAGRDKADRPAVTVPVEHLISLLTHLRDDPFLSFDMLQAHTVIDQLAAGQFDLVYMLTSTLHGHSIMVTTTVPRDNPVAPTASNVWLAAHWQEREAYDMFGVLYDGHGDLRRVFLEDNWQGHPLRKDYKDGDMLELPK